MSFGMPSLAGVSGAVNVVTLLASDAKAIFNMFSGPQWGITDQYGNPILLGESVLAVDCRKEYRVADYPVEQGGFAQYNKVAVPGDLRVTFAASGKQSFLSTMLSGGAIGAMITGSTPGLAARTQILTTLKETAASLALVNVAVPEGTYIGYNVTHYDYRREARNGVTMIEIDVWLTEIRTTATSTFSNTQQPSGQDPTNAGNVQTSPPSSAASNGLLGYA